MRCTVNETLRQFFPENGLSSLGMKFKYPMIIAIGGASSLGQGVHFQIKGCTQAKFA